MGIAVLLYVCGFILGVCLCLFERMCACSCDVRVMVLVLLNT